MYYVAISTFYGEMPPPPSDANMEMVEVVLGERRLWMQIPMGMQSCRRDNRFGMELGD